MSEPLPEEWVEAGHYPDMPAAAEHSLVVLAMGLPCWIRRTTDGMALLVEPHVIALVQAELAQYAREQAEESARELEERPGNWWAPAGYVWALALAYLQQARDPTTAIAEGAVSHEAIWREHEWWRALTALFLHGDLQHLLSNIGFGLLFAVPLQRLIGPGLMLWSFLLTGFVGNLWASLIRSGDSVNSIGASTAVFGVLGTLVGVRMWGWIRANARWHWREIIVPLGGGCALFALLGASPVDWRGQPIDNIAHLTGFLSGLILGALWIWATPERMRTGHWALGLAWLALVPVLLIWG